MSFNLSNFMGKQIKIDDDLQDYLDSKGEDFDKLINDFIRSVKEREAKIEPLKEIKAESSNDVQQQKEPDAPEKVSKKVLWAFLCLVGFAVAVIVFRYGCGYRLSYVRFAVLCRRRHFCPHTAFISFYCVSHFRTSFF